MLVVTRKRGEGIVIRNEIHITVLAIEGNRVRLGFQAPGSVSVLRQELRPRSERNVAEADVEYRVTTRGNPDEPEPDERGQERTPHG